MNAKRRPLIAGNWKMHAGGVEGMKLAAAVRAFEKDVPHVDLLVAPPYTAIAAIAHELDGSSVLVAAQNVHGKPHGAFTGECSASMLKEAGATWVIVGHSERRQIFGETDEIVAKKLRAVLAADMQPIVCVGESLAQREAGETNTFCTSQVRTAFANLPADKAARCVVAYEPIWAIGTGRNATPDDANDTISVLRSTLRDIVGATADEMRILYGGSVKPGNAADLMAMPEIDGGLVGGASLDPDDFARIIRYSR